MTIDPIQLKKDLYPVPSYSDLIKRLKVSLSYSFVRKAYPHTMQEAQVYARRRSAMIPGSAMAPGWHSCRRPSTRWAKPG